MKMYKLTLLLLILPFFASTQNLSGVWIGKLSNDSSTIRQDQSFELALTEYRGKIYGYSYTTFIINDTLYYIVKRIKGKIEDTVCEVKDDEIVSHNFGSRLDKGVKVTQKFLLNKIDTTWHLDGNWQTNATKKYYALTGGVSLKEEKDFDKSRLLQHLGDLQLDNTVAFYKPEKKDYLRAPSKNAVKKQDPVVARNDPGKKQSGLVTDKPVTSGLEIQNPDLASVNTAPDVDIKKPDSSAITGLANEKKNIVPGSGIEENKTVPDTKTDIANVTILNPQIKKPDSAAVTALANEKKNIVPDSGIEENKTVPDTKTDIANVTAAIESNKKRKDSAAVTLRNENRNPLVDSITGAGMKVDLTAERMKNIIQTVNYKSDSLVLSLYDNGEIDGDTVSVFLNGEILMEKQGLKSTAIKKTIYLKPGEDEEVEIILFAENLGRYPPNTGLLLIYDGDDRYEIRFSADYDLSPAIILKRKKSQ